MTPSLEKHSCVGCARRKVRCDKLRPCSNCSKVQSECIYRVPGPSQRHRKRPADSDLLAKLSEYEGLLRDHNIKFNPLDSSWIPSPLEEKLVSGPLMARGAQGAQSPQTDSTSQGRISNRAERQHSGLRPIPKLLFDISDGKGEAACLWSALPKDVRYPLASHLDLGFC
jgi:hypothetical protein